MPHYVNIAWGFIFWRVFLFVGWDGSLIFCFYHLKINQLNPEGLTNTIEK